MIVMLWLNLNKSRSSPGQFYRFIESDYKPTTTGCLFGENLGLLCRSYAFSTSYASPLLTKELPTWPTSEAYMTHPEYRFRDDGDCHPALAPFTNSFTHNSYHEVDRAMLRKRGH